MWLTVSGNDYLDTKPAGCAMSGPGLTNRVSNAVAAVLNANPNVSVVMLGYPQPTSGVAAYCANGTP